MSAHLGKINSSQKLSKFREILKKIRCSAYIIPHNDAHFSEYICPRDERVAFISNFTGSAGCCVITQEKALLWTDGRYFKQASQELSEEWSLMKSGVKGVPSISLF